MRLGPTARTVMHAASLSSSLRSSLYKRRDALIGTPFELLKLLKFSIACIERQAFAQETSIRLVQFSPRSVPWILCCRPRKPAKASESQRKPTKANGIPTQKCVMTSQFAHNSFVLCEKNQINSNSVELASLNWWIAISDFRQTMASTSVKVFD